MAIKTVWPSGLRRWLQAPVRKGVGSNPTAVIRFGRRANHAMLADFIFLRHHLEVVKDQAAVQSAPTDDDLIVIHRFQNLNRRLLVKARPPVTRYGTL